MGDSPRPLTQLAAAESLALLGSVPLGRVVFTCRALPVVRPVNHIIDDGAIVIRSHEGAAIVSVTRQDEGVVVAYQADAIDPAEGRGWSVVATGLAHLVTDRGEVHRYQKLLRPWVAGQMDYVIRIRPDMITGFRLTADNDAAPSRDGPVQGHRDAPDANSSR